MSDHRASVLRAKAVAKCEAGVRDDDVYVSDEEPVSVDECGAVVGYWVKVEVWVSVQEVEN